MKILLRQKSGLGNQLFQYAACLYFARKHAASLEIIREPQELAVSYGHPRPFMLSKFNITSSVRQRTGWDRLLCSTSTYKRPLAAPMRRFTSTQLYKPHFSLDWLFLPELPLQPRTRAIYLDAYFQAHQYAENVQEQLRHELMLQEEPAGKNLETLVRIHECETPVSLHVRRGDYTAIYGGRDTLPIAYYQNAIATIRQHVPQPTFFVFSDDISFCRESLPAGGRYIFVDHNSETAAHEDLRLMSSCHHHIIANSSFSWWGAWLNPSPNKMVLAPDRWLDPNVPCVDLLPPLWQRVSTQASPVSVSNQFLIRT